MSQYDINLKKNIIKLRKSGLSYRSINKKIGINIPKSTLSGWCRSVKLPDSYTQKLILLNRHNLKKARQLALISNQDKQKQYLYQINSTNLPIAKKISDYDTGLIALSMLCLGEASKSKTKHKSFSLGSSDFRIIQIFLALLKRIPDFDLNKTRCTVQCRMDQDTKELELYWQKITKIPASLFYPSRKDPRTKNKPTLNSEYKGVLVIDYYNKKTQLILESLANLVYNQLS